VNVLETAQDLIQKIADVLVADRLSFKQLVQVRLHETLHNVDVFHLIYRGRTYDVLYVDYILVSKSGQNFYFAECALTIRLVLEWRYLFNGNTRLSE
jgi:hypothetical protein